MRGYFFRATMSPFLLAGRFASAPNRFGILIKLHDNFMMRGTSPAAKGLRAVSYFL